MSDAPQPGIAGGENDVAELSRNELVALSCKPESYRKKFENGSQRREARKLCRADADAAKCSIDGKPVKNWLCGAGPKEIGRVVMKDQREVMQENRRGDQRENPRRVEL